MPVCVQLLEARRMLAAVLDDSFGVDGFAPGGAYITEAIGRRADGSVLFGTSVGYDHQRVTAVRPDGSVDASFHSADEYDNNLHKGFALDRQDRMVYVGEPKSYPTALRMTAFRYLPDGTLDDTFAAPKVPNVPDYHGQAVAALDSYGPKIDSQNRVYVQLFAMYGPDSRYGQPVATRVYLDRLLPDGRRDTGFGDGGRLLISTTDGPYRTGVDYAFTADDKIVVLRSPVDAKITLTRYTSRGRPDTSFGDDGTATLPEESLSTSAALAVDATGRTVVSYVRIDRPGRVQIRRFTASGAPDATFGSGGLTGLRDKAFRDAYADFLTVDDDGRIVGSVDAGLFRLTPDGLPDATFAPNSVIDTGQPTLIETLVTPDGIYAPAVVGETNGTVRFVDTATVRLNATSGELSVVGTPKGDRIRVRAKNGGVGVTLGGAPERVYRGVTSVRITALGGRDIVTATAPLHTIVGLGGGDDTFDGGSGITTVLGGKGDDVIVTGKRADFIDGGLGDDTIFAGRGNDTVLDAYGNNSVHGGDGDDSVRTGDGRDAIYGDNGNDTMYANGGVDTLYGGDGDDVFHPGPARDFVYGGPGRDRMSPAVERVIDSIEARIG